jgi:hypothetical protein
VFWGGGASQGRVQRAGLKLQPGGVKGLSSGTALLKPRLPVTEDRDQRLEAETREVSARRGR